MAKHPILQVALPTPLRRLFEYLPLTENSDQPLLPGMRVSVPFGKRKLVGFIVALSSHPSMPPERLRTIDKVIDKEPVIPEEMLHLYQWSAHYYQHPIGEVFTTALPAPIRKGATELSKQETFYFLTRDGKGVAKDQLKRAPRQQQLLQLVSKHENGVSYHAIKTLGLQGSPLKRMLEKGWLRSEATTIQHQPLKKASVLAEAPLTLTSEQRKAVDTLCGSLNRFVCFLLEGVTGSGKTEVYLQVIEQVLARKKSALILVPEIGLTPQTVNRFKQRFNAPIALLHSGRSDTERMHDWMAASQEPGHIVIGTRSSVFTPVRDLGIIIIDEEHDLSFKQQDGMHYNARDLGVTRARKANIPVVLGSATPSLESLHNSMRDRYTLMQLTQRAGEACPPRIRLIDIRSRPLQGGLAQPVIDSISKELDSGNQVLVFINQRGFAPVLMCHQCGWIAHCTRCDARLTLHSQPTQLRCHHCSAQRSVPQHCPECGADQLKTLGVGTEGSEQVITQLFPDFPVHRIDRDSTSSRSAMKDILSQINTGEPCIMVGTQMLAKGHHFPKVTLVVILEADYGLFSADFRGLERMGQLITQVSGRAGRAQQPGEVIIQTHHPDHPLLNQLIGQGYSSFARQLLEERKQAQLPPYSHTVLFRAESVQPQHPMEFLNDIKSIANRFNQHHPQAMEIFGPVPATLFRRAGRFRYQLLIQAGSRKNLHQRLTDLCLETEQLKSARKVRWAIDVDPQDCF